MRFAVPARESLGMVAPLGEVRTGTLGGTSKM